MAASSRQDFLTKVRRVRYSIASRSLLRGLADIGTLLLAYHPERDGSFDRRFGTDTAGSVLPSQLGISDLAVREQAIRYLPSPARVTRWMLENVGVDPHDFTFIDLGCGKGRGLMVAAEYPFKSVIGVEISEALCDIARDNLRRIHAGSPACSDITVACTDATRFSFPDTNLLIHLYHPFAPAQTSAVLSQLERSVTTGRVLVAYLSLCGRSRASSGGIRAVPLASADTARAVSAWAIRVALLLDLTWCSSP